MNMRNRVRERTGRSTCAISESVQRFERSRVRARRLVCFPVVLRYLKAVDLAYLAEGKYAKPKGKRPSQLPN